MPETRILKNISMYMALGQKSCRGTFYVLGEIVIQLFFVFAIGFVFVIVSVFAFA